MNRILYTILNNIIKLCMAFFMLIGLFYIAIYENSWYLPYKNIE